MTANRRSHDLSLPQQLQLGQNFQQAGIRRHTPLNRAAFVVAWVEPRPGLRTQDDIGSIEQDLMPCVPQQQFQSRAVGVNERAGTLQVAARAPCGHPCVVQLHGHGQQQVPGVRVRAVQQLCRTLLRRGVQLLSGVLAVGVGWHGADRSAKRYQGVSRG